ncbi:MAG: hypothetical protein RIC12_02195 [Pirellulales bacterium]
MSDPLQSESIKAVYMRAIEIDDLEERRRLVEQACGSDEVMRSTVQQLLAARDRQDGNVLDEVVVCLGPDETQGASPRSGNWLEPTDVSRMPQIDRYKICELIGEGGMCKHRSNTAARVGQKVQRSGFKDSMLV